MYHSQAHHVMSHGNSVETEYLIWGNHPVTFSNHSMALQLSLGSVCKEVGFDRVCLHWAPCQLMYKMKQMHDLAGLPALKQRVMIFLGES
jgi:hypothetical protein